MECKNIMKTMCFDINNKYHHFPQDDYDQERGVERGWDRHWRRGAVNGSLSMVAHPTYSGTLWHSRHIVRIAVGWMCESPDAISQYQAFFYPNFSNFEIIPINNLVCCQLRQELQWLSWSITYKPSFSNSSDSKVKVKVKGPNMCYIFEKHVIQGYRI